ncbi:efflux RND transporter permease subunit [Oceanicella actignis]|uniref:efflux RND transporter permease subunit n=1 Tax=Oceanicella actignis TaxID=1189325 RepID=UPI0011E87045|nr:efflux RND transporter permease subunit [Oceanicella actignis]TYO89937.1 multidrug efflux pump [Oceanicella actignis]
MTGMVDWAVARARMILAFIALSLGAGWIAYVSLPKEGEPDIDIPMIFVSAPFPGISAEDSERLLVKPLEQELRGVTGLDKMTSFAAENYAGVLLQFEFGWDKSATIAAVREAVDKARTEFPAGAEEPSVDEFNFSEFPILVVALSGDAPERTMLRLAKDLQRDIESLPHVLEAGLAGQRDEMLEVVIDPLKLEAYDITAQELTRVVTANNRLVAAGALESGSGQFSIKLPGSFETPRDVYALPVKTNGDRVVTLGDVAAIRLTFEDAKGTARYNGKPTVALQIVKRKGQPVIDTVAAVRARVEQAVAAWPEPLRQAVKVSYAMNESTKVAGMVSQLEGSVLTAIALVMVVVLGALGLRSALLVGFAIPTSFLLTFAFMAIFGMSITNIVMFGLILAVGMLVDGAIVVVEYADQRIREGTGPMRAYAEAARRMFWPIVSSTATTLCAFLPMLFWPGIPGQFMGNLPVTLIFVLSASLVVALIYLPVLGGVAGRMSRAVERAGAGLGAMLGRAPRRAPRPVPQAGVRRTPFGRFTAFIVGNPVMPFVAIALTCAAVFSAFTWYGANNKGVEFFVKTEPERANAYVRARGNLSLAERDRLVKAVEDLIIGVDGVASVFSFAGEGGLNQRGGNKPLDAVGQIQIELAPWGTRRPGDEILAEINERISIYPGVFAEIEQQRQGPQQGKPVQLRLTGQDWDALLEAARIARARFDATPGLVEIEDTRPLPGIDWKLDVDVATAGRFGADVSTIGAMVSLVTRGVLLDTMRPDGSDDEIEIRVRYPEDQRTLATLDGMRVRTPQGLVPLSNFVSRAPEPKLGQIQRYNGERFFFVKADVAPGVNANQKIAELNEWLKTNPLPAGVSAAFAGDQEEQAESQQFLMKAFVGALGLMFVILLAQFNSFYNSALVLTAVVMSVAGVLVGMIVMEQPFSIIMTGTGIVALAGIVVNNNIVLIDTYQEFARIMPPIEAIVRTAEQRIRPVLLTTITTMAGLTPMMFGVSVDFLNGGYTIDAPTALWWKQLATAVVFGLGLATALTLIFTPAALAARVWVGRGREAAALRLRALFSARARDDLRLARAARRAGAGDLIWSAAAPLGAAAIRADAPPAPARAPRRPTPEATPEQGRNKDGGPPAEAAE